MATNTIIKDWDIFVILNHFFSSGSDIQLKTPYQRKPLFQIKLEKEQGYIYCDYSIKEYERELAQMQRNGKGNEIPRFQDIKEVFLQSGLFEYPNLSDLLLLIKKMSQRDLIQGDRPLFLGLDTNLYRDRFYTTQYDWLKLLPRNKIGLMLSPHVQGELRVSGKYRESHIHKLRDSCVHPYFRHYINEFQNQNRLEDRKKRLGFEETEKINHLHWIVVLPRLDKGQLQGNEDQNIIVNYELAARERNIDILLLSRDRDFIDMAQGCSGLHTLLLETPRQNIKLNKARSWYHLTQFIYVLAVQFGVIALENSNLTIVLQGIWRGKNHRHWDNECLKLTVEKENKPASGLLKNLKIIENMNWKYE